MGVVGGWLAVGGGYEVFYGLGNVLTNQPIIGREGKNGKVI